MCFAAFGDASVRPVLILATAFALVTISDAFIRRSIPAP